MNAQEITRLLEQRHKLDVFVSQCKNGRSWGQNLKIMDAWAMNRSWSNMIMTGYEIKVSRGDFLNDDKWHAYLPLCNRLYFVAPKGIIKETELPQDVGLLEVSGTGNSLVTKRKAAHRVIQPPSQLLTYILMCRTRIERAEPSKEEKLDYWRSWLKQRKEHKMLGHGIRREIMKHVSEVECENHKVRAANEQYAKIKEFVKELGINPDYATLSQVQHHLSTRAGTYVLTQLAVDAQRAFNAVSALHSSIERVRNKQQQAA